MSYYLRVVPDRPSLEAWKIDSHVASRLGIANPERSPGTYFKAAPGETIWEAIQRQTPWFEPDGESPFHEARLKPGQYYPRIARPIEQHPHEAPGWSPGARYEANVIAIARSQLIALIRRLDRICQTVHPVMRTFGTFGHDIRNLLIIACTEVEAHWRGVLVANGLKRDRYTTNEYVSLMPAMKLDEYAVTFPCYPWLDAIYPFRDWGSSGKPTQDLKWYEAYNAVKHDRETEFERATLRHVFEAVSACFVMVAAQFGSRDGSGIIRNLVRFSNFPQSLNGLQAMYIFSHMRNRLQTGPLLISRSASRTTHDSKPNRPSSRTSADRA